MCASQASSPSGRFQRPTPLPVLCAPLPPPPCAVRQPLRQTIQRSQASAAPSPSLLRQQPHKPPPAVQGAPPAAPLAPPPALLAMMENPFSWPSMLCIGGTVLLSIAIMVHSLGVCFRAGLAPSLFYLLCL